MTNFWRRILLLLFPGTFDGVCDERADRLIADLRRERRRTDRQADVLRRRYSYEQLFPRQGRQ